MQRCWISAGMFLFVLLAWSLTASAQQGVPCDQLADSSPPQATAAVRQEICLLVESGVLPELRWPSFVKLRTQARQFYAASNYQPVWTVQDQPTAQARALAGLMQSAALKGLRPEDYDASRWAERLQRFSSAPGVTPAEVARFDIVFTVSVLRYLSDLNRGRINPNQVEFALAPKTFPAAEFLRTRVLGAADVKSAVEQAEPSLAGYRRTLQALQSYVELARQGDGDPLPPLIKPVSPGGAYAGVPQLTRRLQRLGDLAPDAPLPAQPGIYDGALVLAVRHFQQRHGLMDNGRIGPETYQQLSVPLSRRVAQLQLTLERWRWLPDNLQHSLVAINIPEFRLRAYEDHKEVLSMRVIVGKSFDHHTPVFADDMEYVIFRPYWNVPTSIVRAEIVPALRRRPNYLSAHHMEAVNRHGEIVTSQSKEAGADMVSQLKSGSLELRQRPGPGNALGLVKFILPNQYSVYLHGTPESHLFQRARRDFSHGCIRVEDPPALAAWVLRDNPGWTPERIQAAMNGEQSLQVNLKHTIPVLVLYGTAFVQENGEVSFLEDIYSLDAALQRALDGTHP